MNIKEFKNKFDLTKEVKEFNLNKKKIKQMIDNAKKNGEDIDKLCDEILEVLSHIYNFKESDYIRNNIFEIKKIVGGKINE